ncbi:MAG: acyloxyacyl hydrolase, partial [Woeseia sp.]
AAPFISFGPTYRFHLGGHEPGRWYFDIASHPMYVSNSHFGGKDLGGALFFTSYLGLGACLNRTQTASLVLRYQHTSNAGLDDVNPGVDMIGLSFSYRFGDKRQSLVADPGRN